VQQEQRQEGFGVLNTVPESSVLVRPGWCQSLTSILQQQ
jgi:hypothetical protein